MLWAFKQSNSIIFVLFSQNSVSVVLHMPVFFEQFIAFFFQHFGVQSVKKVKKKTFLGDNIWCLFLYAAGKY